MPELSSEDLCMSDILSYLQRSDEISDHVASLLALFLLKQNLYVVRVDTDRNLIYVNGAVPGNNGKYLFRCP